MYEYGDANINFRTIHDKRPISVQQFRGKADDAHCVLHIHPSRPCPWKLGIYIENRHAPAPYMNMSYLTAYTTLAPPAPFNYFSSSMCTILCAEKMAWEAHKTIWSILGDSALAIGQRQRPVP